MVVIITPSSVITTISPASGPMGGNTTITIAGSNFGTTPTVTIDGLPATVQFSGRAPCCVGLDQFNVVVPTAVHVGTAVNVVVSIGGKTTNTVTLQTKASGSSSPSPTPTPEPPPPPPPNPYGY